ncbi:MAG: alpha/beta hydrolase [Bacteroidetes bacterium]|nr:alpha/beta hydrolase [Bacteroidota bacterium]
MTTPKTSGYAPVNGLQMYYEIHGEGEVPLVLIHGGGSTIESSFANVIPLFHGKLIAVEMQAHGRTTDRDAPESFEQDADDIAGLLKFLHVSKANFFGFSNGGTTTLQLAIRHPDIVNKIVSLAGADKRDRFPAGFFEGFEGATIDNLPVPLKDAFLKVTPDTTRLHTMFSRDVERMKNFPDIPDEQMKSIKVPVLLITGDQDVISPEATIKMHQLIPGSRLLVLPGPHGACIGTVEAGPVYAGKTGTGQPQITVGLVEEFLKS